MNESRAADLTPFQVAVLVLSVFVLLLLAVELIVPIPSEVARLTSWIDSAVCAVLFVDFSIRFYHAESKLQFMRWGWIDLLASVPAIEALRFGRVLRVLRLLRLIRALRSLRAFFSIVFASRTSGGVAMVATVAFLTLSLASVGILIVEGSGEGNIESAGDALWWSLATVTTVGYGDVYPVTDLGRAIAAVLMLVGVGLFGTLSGAVASAFVGPGSASSTSAEDRKNSAELEELRREVKALRAQLGARSNGPD